MLSQVQLVRDGASCGEGREVVNSDEGEMSGAAGTPSLIDLNKMLGCKLGELCLCLDVCAKVVGGERGDGWGSHAHFTVQLLWHPPPRTTHSRTVIVIAIAVVIAIAFAPPRYVCQGDTMEGGAK